MVTGNLFTTKLLKIQWLRLPVYVFNKKILTISLLLVILI